MKKTIVGIVIMAVAIMMTLSGAVFAAGTMNVTTSASKVKPGETVEVTVNYPENTVGRQYTVTYNKDVLEAIDEDSSKSGSFVVAGVGKNNDLNAVASETFKFKAKAEGTSNVSVSNIKLSDASNTPIADVTANVASVEVAEEKAQEPAPVENNDNNNEANADENKADETKTDDTKSTSSKDTTVTKTKNIKAGFDAMYLVYLAAAILVAGGIVAVAKRN